MPGARKSEDGGSGTNEHTQSGQASANSGNLGSPREQEIVILVDASNVAHGKTSSATAPKIANLKRLLDRLGGNRIRIVALADASLRHKIDQPSELESMMASGLVEQVPAGTTADDFLWQLWKSYTAQGSRAYIVTNDRFPSTNAATESRSENPRIAFMFVGTELVFQPPIESVLSAAPAGALNHLSDNTRLSAGLRNIGQGLLESLNREDVQANPEREPVESESSAASPEQGRPTRSHDDLIRAAMEVIAAYTQPPGFGVSRVNFATIAHLLYQKVGGDFVAKFELHRPKDLAVELAEMGLVSVSFTNTTMYLEPTALLEERFLTLKLPRRDLTSDERHSTPPPQNRAETLAPKPASPAIVGKSLPGVIEVSSRDLGPTVEIPDLDLFLKLVQDSHPKHVFHWWSQRHGDSDSLWQLEGEFFFVSEGTTYRLFGHGYRTLADFVDGRARGMREATDPKMIGDPKDRSYYDSSSRPQIWKEILRARDLDEYEYRPSEGDVYYCAREKGFSDFAAFLSAERAKPKPEDYI